MVACNLKIRLLKAVTTQYFLFGMLVGMLIGVFLMTNLKDSVIETPFFRINTVNTRINDSEVPNEVLNVVSDHVEKDHHHGMVNESLVKKLYDEVKVLCWIMTGPQNHDTKAKHIKATWGKRCNYLLFMSTEEDPSLPSIALPVIEDRANLWGKTKEAFKYIYQHHFDKADWFFKADDDTFTIMENMRYMLYNESSNKPIFYGSRFKPFVKQGYMSGGSGYVLSKEALRRFVTQALPNPEKCKEANTGVEDVEMGKCLEAVGVEAGDSRDENGRSRFLPVFLSKMLTPGAVDKKHWLWNYNYYPLAEGMECCSDYIISVHYVDPRNLYLLEYLVYHVRAFGLGYNPSLDFGTSDNNRTRESAKNKNVIEQKKVF